MKKSEVQEMAEPQIATKRSAIIATATGAFYAQSRPDSALWRRFHDVVPEEDGIKRRFIEGVASAVQTNTRKASGELQEEVEGCVRDAIRGVICDLADTHQAEFNELVRDITTTVMSVDLVVGTKQEHIEQRIVEGLARIRQAHEEQILENIKGSVAQAFEGEGDLRIKLARISGVAAECYNVINDDTRFNSQLIFEGIGIIEFDRRLREINKEAETKAKREVAQRLERELTESIAESAAGIVKAPEKRAQARALVLVDGVTKAILEFIHELTGEGYKIPEKFDDLQREIKEKIGDGRITTSRLNEACDQIADQITSQVLISFSGDRLFDEIPRLIGEWIKTNTKGATGEKIVVSLTEALQRNTRERTEAKQGDRTKENLLHFEIFYARIMLRLPQAHFEHGARELAKELVDDFIRFGQTEWFLGKIGYDDSKPETPVVTDGMDVTRAAKARQDARRRAKESRCRRFSEVVGGTGNLEKINTFANYMRVHAASRRENGAEAQEVARLTENFETFTAEAKAFVNPTGV